MECDSLKWPRDWRWRNLKQKWKSDDARWGGGSTWQWKIARGWWIWIYNLLKDQLLTSLWSEKVSWRANKRKREFEFWSMSGTNWLKCVDTILVCQELVSVEDMSRLVNQGWPREKLKFSPNGHKGRTSLGVRTKGGWKSVSFFSSWQLYCGWRVGCSDLQSVIVRLWEEFDRRARCEGNDLHYKAVYSRQPAAERRK